MKNKLKTLVRLIAVAASGWLAAPAVFASNDTWVGNADGNWGTAANWTFSSGSAVNPSGDYLIFGAAGSSGASLTNNLSSYDFSGISFNSGGGAYTFNGNSFVLAGGITNNAGAQIINNNVTLGGNETFIDGSGNITLGGVIGDGGHGYGLTFPGAATGGHTIIMTNVNTYSGPTIFGGNFGGANGGFAFDYNGQGSSPNSTFQQGVKGSGNATYYVSNPNQAGTVQRTGSFVYDGVALGGNNFQNFTINGTSAGNVVEEFGPLTLDSGMLNGTINTATPGDNAQVVFSGVTRNAGTSFYFGRINGNTTTLGIDPIASPVANSANIVFTSPPASVGNEGSINTNTGTPDVSIVPWADVGANIAVYDSTYGLRVIASSEQTALVSGMALSAANGGTAGQNATLNANTSLSANTTVNSLSCAGVTLNMQVTNTLTVTSGRINAGVGPTLGASANDGIIAFGPAEGEIYTENSRHTTINACITGSGGVTYVLDDFNSTGTSCALYGTNTYTGVTRVEGNNAGMSVLLYNSLALQNSTLDYNNYGASIVFESGPGKFNFGGLEGAQNLGIPYPLTLGGDGDSTTYSGILSGAGSLTKIGAGAFTLSGANTYSGGTILSGGRLNINYGGSSIANSAIGTAALTISNGVIDNTSGSAVTLAPSNAQNWDGNFTFGGSSSLNLGNGLVALGGNVQVTVNANTLTVGGVISGGGDSLTTTGGGTLALSAANTYSGNTTIGGGTLALTGGGSIASSPSIIVNNGATFDVSGVSSTFTLGGSQSLLGNGTVNGAVATSSGSQIQADAGVAYGTNTFNNNLTLVSGAVASFQLGTVANGTNDLIIVGGTLTLSGNTINLSAPSASVNLGPGDYTLFTSPNSISGTAAATPNWVVRPLNYGNYSIVTSGNTVKLHYSSTVSPSLTGAANPSSANRGQSTTLTVTVTPGTYPISSVTVNLTPIGGSSVSLVQSNSTTVYTNTVTVGASVSAGNTLLTATATDNQGNIGTGNIALTILPAATTWNGGSTTDNNWSDAANWVDGVLPLGGDAVTFEGTSRLTPVMDSSYTLSSVTFNSTAGDFEVTNAPGAVLTLDGAGVTNSSASPEAINTPIVMDTAQTVNAANGNIAFGGNISGGTSLTLVGSHALALSGTNTFGGGTVVSAGTVIIANNSALGSGTLALNGGSISNSAGASYSVGNSVTISGAANVGIGPGDTFTLSGLISGNANLTETGGGRLVLNNANNNSGGVTVQSGTVVVGNNSALGSGLLTLGNASISNSAGTSYSVANPVNLAGAASVIVGTGDTFTMSGLITNSGSLTLTGSGTLSIPGNNANSYSGGTALNPGTELILGNTSISPLGSGTLTLAGGTLADAGAAPITISNNMVAVTNTISYLNPTAYNGNGLALAGNLSGAGSIVVNGSGTTYDSFLLEGANSGFTGTFTVNASGFQRFAFVGSAAGSPNAAFVFNAAGDDEQKVILGADETNIIEFGSLSGAGWIRNDSSPSLAIIRVGDLNTSTMFSGIFNQAPGSGTIGLLKTGTGTFTMTNGGSAFTGANSADFSGPSEVAAGELLVSIENQCGSLQVDDGATFGIWNFTGSGLYAQASSLAVGTNSGATLLFTNLDSSSSFGEMVVGYFTNNGTCTVKIPDTNNIATGNSYTLITYGAYASSGAGSFVLSSPYVQGYLVNDVPDGELNLVVTNLTSPPSMMPIKFSASGGNLSLSWAASGWYLQAQTNSLSKGLGTNWVDVPGSSSESSVVLPINPANPTVFYRLSSQP